MRVGITADRRWEEQARLFVDRGIEVVHAPTMRTVDLTGSESLRAATVALIEHAPDYLVVSTGMGMKRWLEASGRWGLDTALLSALAGTRIVARGAKAHSAARGAGLDVWWRSPSETMQEIVDHLAGETGSQTAPGAGARVAVQLFEPEGHPSTEALRALAGELVEVPVYQWALPDDRAPAEDLVRAAVAGEVHAITFTAQPAVHNLFRIADDLGLREGLRAALNGPVVSSCVGPVCATAAVEEGVDTSIWPDPPRLTAMVKQLTARLID